MNPILTVSKMVYTPNTLLTPSKFKILENTLLITTINDPLSYEHTGIHNDIFQEMQSTVHLVTRCWQKSLL